MTKRPSPNRTPLKTVRARVADLRQSTKNPRRISEQRLELLMRTLEGEREMLEARPLIALPDGTVIAGNQRLAAAVALGWETIPVVYADVDEATAAKWMLLDNRPFGEDDPELLAAMLRELGAGGLDLEHAGYLSDDVDAILRAAQQVPSRDPDEVPSVPEVPKSRPGDVYELGPHRLMCGDATDAEHVDRLLGGQKPILCVTDPPYGVDYDPNWRADAAAEGHLDFAPTRVRPVASDDRSDWSAAWTLVPGDVFYCWHAGRHAAVVQQSIEHASFEIRNQIVWVKAHLPISRGHYHWRHEPCWYAVRLNRPAGWIGDRKQTTVWEIALDDNVAGGHSTQKPVECMERAIRNHTGDVYDPFCGTGSTLIAAERQRRACFAMEIDPGYCDVIRQRYSDYVGDPALAP